MIFRACERFKILPPDVQSRWEDNDDWTQELLLAYEQGREIEEQEELALLMKANHARI